MVSKFFGGLGRFFITSGVVILMFVGYQLWGTGIQEASAQNDLGSDFEQLLLSLDEPLEITTSTTSTSTTTTTTAAPVPLEPTDSTTSTTSTTTTTTTTAPPPAADEAELVDKLFRNGGEAVAQIQIPQIEVDKFIVQGVQVEDLRAGPGHYRATPFPGQEGNSGIAGHRTTYGAPFNRIDEMVPGEEFQVTTVQGVHTYRVMSAAEAYSPEIRGALGPDFVLPDNAAEVGHIIVPPQATWVLGDFGDNRITLTACHPKFSAALRIIVAAELVSEPVGTLAAPENYAVTDGQLVSEDLSAEELALEVGEGLDEQQAAEIALPDGGEGEALEEIAAAETTEGAEGAEAEAATDDPVDAEPEDLGAAGVAGEQQPPSRQVQSFSDEVSLDEGLNGEKDALQPAIIFGLIAAALYLGFKELARRWKPWPALILGIAPVLFFMALSFEKVDRYLPAG